MAATRLCLHLPVDRPMAWVHTDLREVTMSDRQGDEAPQKKHRTWENMLRLS